MINAVTRTNRGCTEDVQEGLTAEALSLQSPGDLGTGRDPGRLGRRLVEDDCKSTELEPVSMGEGGRGCRGRYWCPTTGRCKDDQVIIRKAFSAMLGNWDFILWAMGHP